MKKSDTTDQEEKGNHILFIKYAGVVFAFSFVVVCALYYMGGDYLSESLGDTTVFRYGEKDQLSYVLLMGVDRREGDAGRSDTLMLAAIDEAHGHASLLSIPRDTRIKVGNYGYDMVGMS